MKLFKCTHCGEPNYFENSRCPQCDYPLGFVVGTLELLPLVAQDADLFQIESGDETVYRYCANHQYGVCNWLVENDHKSRFCEACRLNRTIPNLSRPEYLQRWKVIETAKHRLIYALRRMNLPVMSKSVDPDNGLSFDFLADGTQNHVRTGHKRGLITINIAEADDIEREMTRQKMDEPYRTVLGHFRHEIGHYYWDRLIRGTDRIDAYRALFGDERQSYKDALRRHYQQGPPAGWNLNFISAYASAHPWEDWAETWAHYLHILDTLETAHAFGLTVQYQSVIDPVSGANNEKADPYDPEDFKALMDLWGPLSFAMNNLNRSMGHSDLYPFIIPAGVMEKLSFIHQVCYQTRRK
ncbi:putative zinc-binding metallopeptidase [Larkinella bovis]|uniref:Zinc-binding metallopeptidase n=1 Tax=Larkinella bovis TaxID=683041 RepID=A0ABW0I9K7_9BACT